MIQNQDVRLEKLRLIKRSLLQVNPLIPIHLQLGSMADDGNFLNFWFFSLFYLAQVHDILERVGLLIYF